MSQHVPEDLLQAFVDGDVSEQVAAHIAEHIDDCPACATRAAGLEPLAGAFAAVADPVVPPALVPAILARIDEPERLPLVEVAVGVGLLSASGLLALGLGSPFAFAAQTLVVINAVGALFRGTAMALGSFQGALALTSAAALTGGVLTLHLASRLPPEGLLPMGLWGPGARRIP